MKKDNPHPGEIARRFVEGARLKTKAQTDAVRMVFKGTIVAGMTFADAVLRTMYDMREQAIHYGERHSCDPYVRGYWHGMSAGYYKSMMALGEVINWNKRRLEGTIEK